MYLYKLCYVRRSLRLSNIAVFFGEAGLSSRKAASRTTLEGGELVEAPFREHMPKKYLLVTEVARLMGVTPLTIRNWDAKGKLIAYRNPVNNYRMYKVEDVEALIRQIERSKERPRRLKIDISS